MKTSLLTLLAILFCSQSIVFSQTNDEISIGQKIHFDSEVYGKSRELFVSLPSDYDDTLKKHSVLYILFPKWSFERAKSAASYLEGYHGFPGLILVGLCNEDDWGEVFPFKVDRIPTSGAGTKFLKFISTEAIPYIESNYRTDSIRILAGFSNSAMFATYAMIHEPNLFNSFILSSPMLGWGENFVLNESNDFFNTIKSYDKTLYVVYGDDDYMNVLNSMPKFDSLLRDKAPENLDWKIDVLKNEGHVPYTDVYNGLAYTLRKLKAKFYKELYSDLKGDYFGQTPPGHTPIVFATDIISVDSTIEHGSPSFSPDGNEVFWQSNYRQSGKETQISCMTMHRNKNKWTTPEISSYGHGPVFSPDGKRLYFNNKEKKGTISYIEKEVNKWSDPKNLDLIARFPDLKFAYNLSFTNNGTLYFLGYAEELETMNKYGIYRSELIDGAYAKPELLPSSINKEEGLLNWTPFIAPDESYLLFSSSRHTSENDYGDIYISFRNADGNWTNPVKLSNVVNSDRQERFPAISPDGKFLFFTRWITRGNEDVFWVRSDIITELKDSLMDNQELHELFQSDQADRTNHLSSEERNFNDSIREARVYELLDSNKVITATDYNNAALIFHHGEDSVAYAMAVKLMKKSIELDSTRNKWFVAVIMDRYLLSINKPQIYGTQYKRLEDGKVIKENMDTTQITDAERIEFNVEILAEQREKLKNLNRKKLTELLEEGKSIDEIIQIVKQGDSKNSLYDLRENWLNNFGYQLTREERIEDALKIFRLNTELHPNAYNTFDSYGECLLTLGYKENAIKAYERSLELNPENKNAEKVLSEIK